LEGQPAPGQDADDLHRDERPRDDEHPGGEQRDGTHDRHGGPARPGRDDVPAAADHGRGIDLRHECGGSRDHEQPDDGDREHAPPRRRDQDGPAVFDQHTPDRPVVLAGRPRSAHEQPECEHPREHEEGDPADEHRPAATRRRQQPTGHEHDSGERQCPCGDPDEACQRDGAPGEGLAAETGELQRDL
jgi:hypothetical protein